MTPPGLAPDPALLARLEQAMGEAVRAVDPVRWGTTTPSVAIELLSGALIVAQQVSPAAAERITRATALLAGGGVPVPPIRTLVRARASVLLAFERVAGRPGSELLGGPGQAAMARVMGESLVALRALPVEGWPAEGAWRRPGELRRAVEHRRAGAWRFLEAELPPSRADALRGAIPRAVDAVAGGPWPVVGAARASRPVNAVLAEGGGATLVDLGAVRLRHPLVDPAWWLLVVRHHHREALAKVEGPFLEAALGGLPKLRPGELSAVALVRALRLTVAAPRIRRAHMARLLATALDWYESAAGQACTSSPGQVSDRT